MQKEHDRKEAAPKVGPAVPCSPTTPNWDSRKSRASTVSDFCSHSTSELSVLPCHFVETITTSAKTTSELSTLTYDSSKLSALPCDAPCSSTNSSLHYASSEISAFPHNCSTLATLVPCKYPCANKPGWRAVYRQMATSIDRVLRSHYQEDSLRVSLLRAERERQMLKLEQKLQQRAFSRATSTSRCGSDAATVGSSIATEGLRGASEAASSSQCSASKTGTNEEKID